MPVQIADHLGTKKLRVNSYISLFKNAIIGRWWMLIRRGAFAVIRAQSRKREMESDAVCSPGVRVINK
jgi:hypothetical protein